ncbi:hypothetical protein T492DRAFT_1071644 [Pavlovales sp. CCMP2436]|nr:hypothetical protein T492DRAFT_1071644 [Pavlovales sp. CCMP2436]
MLIKHPRRRTAIPPVIPGLDATDRLVVGISEMQESYRGLKTDKAQGESPWKYEYLIPLAPTVPFVGDAARQVLESHAWLASSFANGDLPPWFYFVFCAARCVPLRKCAAQAARPIGISCALRRGLTKGVFLNKGLRGDIEEYLFSQQLGVLVSAGGTKLIFGVRELLENPHFCIAGSDIYNAFNEGDRAEVLPRPSPARTPLLRHARSQVPDLRHWQGRRPDAHGQRRRDRCRSRVLDAELRPYGGGARAGHDDVRACGPPWIVFVAMQRFHDAFFLRLGLVV